MSLRCGVAVVDTCRVGYCNTRHHEKCLRYVYQFNIKDKGGVLGDTGYAHSAVTYLGGDIDAPLVARTHLGEGNLPAGDEVGETEGIGIPLLGVVIEYAAVDEHSFIIYRHDAAYRGSVA